MFVVFAHLGFLPMPEVTGPLSLGARLVRGVFGNLFSGPPAVIVFFIVSGFCIHYPFRNASSVPLASYLIRRYVRIGLPLLIGILFARWLAPGHPNFDLNATSETVVWSLVAELVYYSIYPLILPCVRRYGWIRTILFSYAAAFVLIGLNPSHRYYMEFGPWATWLVGLPSWLLGCQLAETVGTAARSPRFSIWWWRIGIWFCASASSVLMFHAHVGYPWTLPIFSLVCALWLKRELAYSCGRPGVYFLEWAGQWSYSLYLMHLVVAGFLSGGAPVLPGEQMAWLVRIGAVLVLCYLFYLAVELPSHHFARYLSRRFGSRQAIAV